MPTLTELYGLKGLTASDRTPEEKEAISEQMGYEEPKSEPEFIINEDADTNSAAALDMALQYKSHLDQKYRDILKEQEELYGVDKNSVNTSVNDSLDKIASEVSSHYKKYNGTDKLPLDDQKKKQLLAEYDARKSTYSEQNADIWLDNQFKDIVGENQSWMEQMWNATSHLIPAIEGGAIQTYGMIHGAIMHNLSYLTDIEGYRDNPDLNWFDSFVSDVIDNPITRYGREVEMAGASNVVQGFENILGLSDITAADRIAEMRNTATKYNPEGIGNDAIITTLEQDESYFNSTTPWQALQSGGFTLLSMLNGAWASKLANWTFKGLAKGAVAAHNANKVLKTSKSLERTLEGLKKAQNFTNIAVIPGAVGTVEGALEGLNTKIAVERDGIEQLDNYYMDLVEKEAEELYKQRLEEINPDELVKVDSGDGMTFIQKHVPTKAEIYKEVWDKYQNQYVEARRQIDWASEKAGIHNFWANSMINGMMNTTLKAGLMSDRVQESLRNFKLTGWAYNSPKFNIDAPNVVTSKMSKSSAIAQMLKEPIGEGLEEYGQSVTDKVFSSAAESNITSFIKNKFEGDGTSRVTDEFSSDYAAALTSFTGALTDKESIESAIIGAVSSVMGTAGKVGRGYHRDEKGNIVRNNLFDIRNFQRGLNSKGEQESITDYLGRVTPWRSGALSAYNQRRQEIADAQEVANYLTEWLQDPQNKAKWDGMAGTANWLHQMELAAESNDQFGYRTAQMGKAINDVIMLSKLKGTKFYDSLISDLQKASSGKLSSQEMQTFMQNSDEDFSGMSEEQVAEQIQSNANKMLGLMSTVENESKRLDSILGRIDEDTKQNLIFGKIMEQDFIERRDQLKEELDFAKNKISSSVSNSDATYDDDVKQLILKYGSIKKANEAYNKMIEAYNKLYDRIKELEKIDTKKRSDEQNETIKQGNKQLKALDKTIKRNFSGLFASNGKKKDYDKSNMDLNYLVLNEQEIMNLDPVTRAIFLAQGANRHYNALHQDRKKIDNLNLEIDELNHQIETLKKQQSTWTINGKVRKGHNKQYQRNAKKLDELQREKDSKMRALNHEQGQQETKPIYSSAQQEVIDNLIQQGTQVYSDFIDKVVDMGRLEKSIKDYHDQYQEILSDPNAFYKYVQKAKQKAAIDLIKRRAERVSNIQDYEKYAQELDRLTANASDMEAKIIMSTLREASERQKNSNTLSEEDVTTQETTNYDNYIDNLKQQNSLVRQFANYPTLTDNDQSLLLNAMQYLASKGIDITDRDAAVQTLLEEDEAGILGGKFRQYVESKNSMLSPQQRAFMPHFTSIGQIVNQYVDILNGKKAADEVQSTITPKVSMVSDDSKNVEKSKDTIVVNPPSSPVNNPSPTLGTNPDAHSDHLVDNNGTVATTAQTTIAQQNKEASSDEEKSNIQKLFEGVTTPELALHLSDSSGKITNSIESEEAKKTAMQYLEEIAVTAKEKGIFYDSIEELMGVIKAQSDRLLEESKKEEDSNNTLGIAGGLLKGVYDSLGVKRTRGGRPRTLPLRQRPGNPASNIINTVNIAAIQKENPNAWEVIFTDNHDIDIWLNKNWLKEGGPNQDTNVYIMTNSNWAESNNGELPLVAVVQVDEPSNPDKTTAIPLNGLWYQPIGILPNSTSLTGGAQRTEAIRNLADKDAGLQLITQNGLSNSSPLITHITKVRAHDSDQKDGVKRENTPENNNDVTSLILDFSSAELQVFSTTNTREELLDNDEYKNERNSFLNHLEIAKDDAEGQKVVYVKDRLSSDSKGKEEKGTIAVNVRHKPMAETKDRNTGTKTLTEVLENGSDLELHDFNSRTQRVLDEIIVPLFLSNVKRGKGRDSAKVITKDDVTDNPDIYKEEAHRLSVLLNGYDGTPETTGIKGIKDFIYINQDWKIVVTAPKELQHAGDTIEESTTQFKIYLVNNGNSEIRIELGVLTAGKNDINEVAVFFKNLLWDNEDKQIRNMLNWQVPHPDIEAMNGKPSYGRDMARENIAQIVDDGILEMPASSLGYDIDTIELRNPFRGDGSIAYTDTEEDKPKVLNTDNASSSKPLGDTPLAEGSVVTPKGLTVEPNSGIILEGSNIDTNRGNGEEATNSKLEETKKTVERILLDSKQFKLSEDDLYYYVEDKTTGKITKYLRVTTVIGADESSEIWTPSYEEVYNKLKEKHPEINLTNFDYDNTSDFLNAIALNSGILIDKTEWDRTIAELRTDYKHSKYKGWGTPSAAIGNSTDTITRDFFSGNLKSEYPNVASESLAKFIQQLELFKNDLDAQGITIVSDGIVAYGEVTMRDNDGNPKNVKVAGTLDLFGYDAQGNFYIFDMKTTRDHNTEKLEKEKKKWSRQLSMYADLLKSKYGIDVSPDNLRIIPINVTYDPPIEASPRGPKYTTDDNGQLYTQYRGETSPMPFEDAKPSMRATTLKDQFPPGYTELKINWDNLSSEDQDVVLSLENQLKEEGNDNFKPKEAAIVLPQDASGVTALNTLLSLGLNPLIKSGVTERKLPSKDAKILQLPDWDDLTDSQYNYLAGLGILDSFSYNDLISNPEECGMLAQNMRCRGLL